MLAEARLPLTKEETQEDKKRPKFNAVAAVAAAAASKCNAICRSIDICWPCYMLLDACVLASFDTLHSSSCLQEQTLSQKGKN